MKSKINKSTKKKSETLSRMDLLKLFNDQLKQFFSQLIDLFSDDGDITNRTICADLIMINLFVSQLEASHVVNIFIESLLPLRSYVVERDENFFLDDSHSLFKDLNSSKVNFFKEIWLQLDDTNKIAIWKWFDSFLRLCDRYVSTNK